MPNFRCNGAFGQIPAIIIFYYLLGAYQTGFNVIDHLLRKKTGQARGSRSISLDIYGRLADFVVSESTAEENYCSAFELLGSILTYLPTHFTEHILEYLLKDTKSQLAWSGLIDLV